MNLLILTQTVDSKDPLLGFFHSWITSFAKQCESLTVICLNEGTYDLPENVKVLSLGKEKSLSRVQYLLNFYTYIFKERKNYDHVLVHMNPEYVSLGFLFWKMFRKKIFLWYTHKHVDLKLKIATFLVDKVLTASKESFRINTGKVEVMGHGIDTELFSPDSSVEISYDFLSLGRFSPIKRWHLLIPALIKLKDEGIQFKAFFAGSPGIESDYEYLKILKESSKSLEETGFLEWGSALAHNEIPNALRKGEFFLSLSDTGSLDKSVLESMCAGLIPLTTNEAFKEVLNPYELYLEEDSPEIIVTRLKEALNKYSQNKEIRKKMREYIIEHHSLSRLTKKIIDLYQ